ncbi:GntR family transcriptional regulator [Limnochorda pilosa]|uniref:GntR family transcriptional regulator n=1 Tax=Limnochorda pilosa TaxID=1555112 RepID=UPI001187743F|nr:GntR family transcriptional regulator [Limnochorda pilosa]
MASDGRASATGELATEEPLKVQRFPNLTEQAYHLLRQEILSRRLRAGDRLVERTLGDRYRLSKTPIREAIARLERDGLVVIVPSQGAVVRRLALGEVKDLLECRQALDAFAARRAAERIQREDVVELEQMLVAAERERVNGSPERYREHDAAFHARIREMASNATLLRVMESLESQVRLVMTSTTGLPGRVGASMEEHRRILEALRAKDPDAAALAASEHVARMLEAVEEYWPVIERGDI